MKLEAIDPKTLGPARGFSHGILCPANGRLLFVAGQIGNPPGAAETVVPGFVPQFEQALANVVAVVSAAGGTPESLAA